MKILEKMMIEFIGSFFMCFAINSAAVQYCLDNLDNIGYGLSCFVIMCIILWVAHSISNSQLNPLITLSLILTGHVKTSEGMLLMIFQTLGAIFAAALLKLILPDNFYTQIAENSILGHPLKMDINPLSQMIYEAFGFFIIVLAYYLLIVERNVTKYVYAPGIAGMYFVSRAGLNPARILGLCMMRNFYYQIFTQLFGGLLGAILASLIGSLLISENSNSDNKKIHQKKHRELANIE